jgi:DNA-binding protein H-NS
MTEKNQDMTKMKESYDKVKKELKMVQDIYNGLLEEKARKEEEEAKIREREEARAAEMKHLNKAAEWVQAHWKGLLTRKDKGLKKALAKIRKKKKKARKKAAALAAKAAKA